jgi:hypothetical protein
MLRLGHDRATANRLARELTPQALLIERGTMRAGEEVDILATVCAWEGPSADALVGSLQRGQMLLDQLEVSVAAPGLDTR